MVLTRLPQVCIAAAGILIGGDALETPIEDFAKVMNVNVNGGASNMKQNAAMSSSMTFLYNGLYHGDRVRSRDGSPAGRNTPISVSSHLFAFCSKPSVLDRLSSSLRCRDLLPTARSPGLPTTLASPRSFRWRAPSRVSLVPAVFESIRSPLVILHIRS